MVAPRRRRPGACLGARSNPRRRAPVRPRLRELRQTAQRLVGLETRKAGARAPVHGRRIDVHRTPGPREALRTRRRFLPGDADTREPGTEEYADYLIEFALRAHGFATARTVNYIRRDANLRAIVRRRLAEKARAGDLVAHRDTTGETIYALPGTFDRPPRRFPHAVHILSPFDNVVIQRKRALQVFGFDYTIECYTPAAKRRYGYFALPLLYRDRLIGRMDCKAHRAEGLFEIKALHLEGDVAEAFLGAFASAVVDYAAFTGCRNIAIRAVAPSFWQQPVCGLFD